MKYDFTITDESQRVTLVEDAEIEDGDSPSITAICIFQPDNEATERSIRSSRRGGFVPN
jgi:hypothetical protein